MDGHQHVHLATIVLDVILELTPEQGIGWFRSTAEPLAHRAFMEVLASGSNSRWLAEVVGAAVAQPQSTACNPAL